MKLQKITKNIIFSIIIILFMGLSNTAISETIYENNSWPLRVQSPYGYIDFGPANVLGAHIYTDKPRFFFNVPIWSVTGAFSAYSNENLYLQTNGTTRMTILNADGNVGIGTSSPNNKLEVISGDTTKSIFHVGETENSGCFITSVYDDQAIISGGTDYNLAWYARADSASLINMQDGDILFYGNTGLSIGSAFTPAIKMRIRSNGNVDIYGTTYSTQYACTSDSRYKKDVNIYQNALEKVLGLRGVTYFWNTDKYKDRNFSKEKQIGFIAQEVEKVIPEIVYTDDKGFKTMSYDRLTAVLVEAIKELKVKNDAKITKLEAENEILKADNAELKQKLAGFDSVIDRLASLEREVKKQKNLSFAER